MPVDSNNIDNPICAALRRRDALSMLAATMVIAPPAARGQQKTTPVVGYLGLTSPGPFAPLLAAFLVMLLPGFIRISFHLFELVCRKTPWQKL